MTALTLNACWQAPGYRELTLDLADPQTGKEFRLHIRPADMQRIINACADAAKQIGLDPPIDWDAYPTQIYWPAVMPWKVGPKPSKAEAGR